MTGTLYPGGLGVLVVDQQTVLAPVAEIPRAGACSNSGRPAINSLCLSGSARRTRMLYRPKTKAVMRAVSG